jgi:hypothetical protein
MRNHSKVRNQKPQNRTRVVLDPAEIQRRMSRPAKPTLAELYARETEAAQRDRFYDNETRAYATPPPKPPKASPTAAVWITRPILQTRGWTDTAIRAFLPAPERFLWNPHTHVGRPMPLWRAATVASAESTAEFEQWLRRSLTRRRLSRDDLTDAIVGAGFRQRVERAAAAIDACRRVRS